MDVFSAVIMVNSCKKYSSSFSDVLGMHIASAASLQIMPDHCREAPGERRTKDFKLVFAVHID